MAWLLQWRWDGHVGGHGSMLNTNDEDRVVIVMAMAMAMVILQ